MVMVIGLVRVVPMPRGGAVAIFEDGSGGAVRLPEWVDPRRPSSTQDEAVVAAIVAKLGDQPIEFSQPNLAQAHARIRGA